MNSQRLRATLISGIVVTLAIAGLSSTQASASQAASQKRAVVIVSGGAAISPFTTPTAACKTGYSAGSTDTFMRSYLKARGLQVFTSPAMAGRGQVTDQGQLGGPFGSCPKALPAYMTVNSAGDIELAGVHLANFVNYIHDVYGITEVDFVAHSMGGLYSRSAIAYLKATKSPVKAKSLTTLGTPWGGAIFAQPTDPGNPKSSCDGFIVCESLLDVFAASAPVVIVEDSPAQIAALNAANAGVLRDIPVTMIAGDAFTKPGSSSPIWPNDGIVSVPDALAAPVSDAAITHRRCYLYEGGTHSVYISKAAGLPESKAITWNSTTANWVYRAIASSGKTMKTPNRVGCPAQ